MLKEFYFVVVVFLKLQILYTKNYFLDSHVPNVP